MAMASAGTGLLALAAIGVGAISAAGVLLVLALGSGLYARHWISLAGRSRVGARSEDEVRRALEHLQAEGWRLRHSLPWRGRGDIDSLAIAPTRVAFAIETKTRSVRQSPSRPGAGTGGVAVALASAVVSARRRAGGLPRSPAWRRAGRARRPRDLGRSADPRAAKVRLQPAHCGHAQTQALQSARRLSRVHRGRPADGASGGVPSVPR